MIAKYTSDILEILEQSTGRANVFLYMIDKKGRLYLAIFS